MPNPPRCLIKLVNKNKNRNRNGASTGTPKRGVKASRVMKSTQSVLKYNTSLQGGNSFNTSVRSVDGKKSMVVSGSSILMEVKTPKLPTVDAVSVFGLTPVPLHPLFFNCPRLLGLFSTFIRWKLINIRIRYVPRCPTTVTGEIVMGFTSCIQDGGPSASMDLSDRAVKSAIVDLPGSVVSHIGSKSPACDASFLKALDWKFTCRDGLNVNVIYSGLFIAAIDGDFTKTPVESGGYSIGGLHCGSLVLDYEIALHEHASILNFSANSYLRNALWMPQNVNDTQALRLQVPSGTTPYRTGTVSSFTYLGGETIDNDNLYFGDDSTRRPVTSQQLYFRQGALSAADPTKYELTIHENLEDATMNRNALTNRSGAAMNIGSWSTYALEFAKVILPVAAKAAVALI